MLHLYSSHLAHVITSMNTVDADIRPVKTNLTSRDMIDISYYIGLLPLLSTGIGEIHCIKNLLSKLHYDRITVACYKFFHRLIQTTFHHSIAALRH